MDYWSEWLLDRTSLKSARIKMNRDLLVAYKKSVVATNNGKYGDRGENKFRHVNSIRVIGM
jgi:hypothetical protein